MHGTIDLVISPEKRDPANPPRLSRFGARLRGDDRVLCVSDQPFVDAARALIAEGHDPETALVMRHKGSETIAPTARLGAAAKLTVREGDRPPHFASYVAFQGPAPVGGSSHFEEEPDPPEPRPDETPVARPARTAPPASPASQGDAMMAEAEAWLLARPHLRAKVWSREAAEGTDTDPHVWPPGPRPPGWTRLRYELFKRSGWRCESCGLGHSDGNPLQIDHIKPRSKYRNADQEENFQVLCRACNIGKSNRDETALRVA
jgi:rubredoxin